MNTIQESKYSANFMIGAGSILNIASIFNIPYLSTPEDDLFNMQNDFKQLGQDMIIGMKEVTDEYGKKIENAKIDTSKE